MKPITFLVIAWPLLTLAATNEPAKSANTNEDAASVERLQRLYTDLGRQVIFAEANTNESAALSVISSVQISIYQNDTSADVIRADRIKDKAELILRKSGVPINSDGDAAIQVVVNSIPVAKESLS